MFDRTSAVLFVFCVIQNGIQLKKTVEEDEEDGTISNKKPRKATLAKAKLYGCFVKVISLFLNYWVNILKWRAVAQRTELHRSN